MDIAMMTLGIVVKTIIAINGIISDGDTNLPLLMSRIMLEIKWKK